MLISDGTRHWGVVNPERTAIVRGPERITYGDLAQRQAAVAASTAERCAAGDAVALLIDDPTEFVTSFLGVIEAGCVAVPLAPGWTAAEVARALAVVRPGLVVTDRESVEAGARVTPRLLREPGGTIAADSCSSDAAFYVGFTSGSSGVPKGVIRSHRAWLNSFHLMSLEFGISADDAVVVPGSLFFSFSLIAALHALFIGAQLVLPERPSPAGLLALLRLQERATVYALPSTLVEVLRLAGRRRTPLRGVRRIITAGEKLDAATKAAVPATFPDAELFEYYGASELGYVSILRPEDQQARPDSVGRPVLGAEVAILDEDGNRLAPGTPGLLCAQTEYGFSGYLGDERGSDAIEHHGWRTVGDLARQDEEGFLYLVGRRDNMVVIRGQNTYPEETEAALRAIRGVVRAVAVPEPAGTPTHLVALVEAAAGITGAAILAGIRGVLSGPRLPRRVLVVERLRLTATGKVDRQAAAVQLREGVVPGTSFADVPPLPGAGEGDTG